MSRNLIRTARRIGTLGCAASLLLSLPSSCSDGEISNKGAAGNSGSARGGGGTVSAGNGGSGAAGSNAAGGAGATAAGNGGSSNGNGGSSNPIGGAAGTGGVQRDAGSGGAAGTGGIAGGPRVDASAGGGGAGGARPDGSSAGTGGSAGAGVAPPCLNGKKDGDETGVDCGGSCPACVNYKINAPARSNTLQSACNGGPGYMCARSMVFSPEFKQAAMDDWGMPDPPFVYGTVGHDPDIGGLDANANTCCQCYQLVFESPVGATAIPIPKPMIVQVFNTAAGGGMNFDIYMAAGGFGANNGCAGGANPMYSTYPDLGGNFSGGVKATRYTQCSSNGQFNLTSISTSTCQTFVTSQCDLIQATASAQNQSTSQGSCEETNFPESHYHINWNVRAKRVECPDNLTRVTGCKLNNQGLPAATPAAQNVSTADGTFRTGYHTTTMQDCCRPTCAFPANVANTDPTYSVFYTCDKAGTAQ
jgi:hypothetical protein